VRGRRRHERLQAVAGECGPRAARAELLERVPRPGVAVAGPVQVDAVAAGDERGDGYRPQQITHQRRNDVLHSCRSPPFT
jgi:hypothetical protein